jgi:hypothetical protein
VWDKAEPPQFALLKLGRRAVEDRTFEIHPKPQPGTVTEQSETVGKNETRKLKTGYPHKFWATYMSRVASPEVGGQWEGLAPMRFEFTNRPTKLLCLRDGLTQQVDAQAISQVEVEAFPKAYLCPIGWVVGAVAELRGRFLLTEIPLLVERLRSEPVFLYKGNQATLDYALLQMHALVRSAFLIEKVPRGHTKLEIYTVCSPLSFDGQESFSEKAGLNFPVVFQIIGRDSDARQVVTRKRNASTVTVLNRGTMLFTRLITGEDAQLQPSCGLSNLKNLLMMTAIMQKYHEQTRDHINLDVRKMRRSVAKSFMRLVGCWKSPHFKEMTAPGEKENLGLSKMLVPEERSSIEHILEVTAVRLNFCGAE